MSVMTVVVMCCISNVMYDRFSSMCTVAAGYIKALFNVRNIEQIGIK